MPDLYHIFKDETKNYLYLTEYKQLFCINDDTYECLLDPVKSVGIIAKYVDRVNSVDQKPLAPMKDMQYSLFLCISNTCNARCTYCFAHQGDYGKSRGIMHGDTAYSSIDYFMNYVPESATACIIFFGGEPIMAYKTLVDTCEYTNHKFKGRKYSFHLVTNATLLTREIIDYLSKYEFGVGISIDGGPDIQNQQRPMVNGCDSYYETTKNLQYLLSKVHNVHARGTYCNFDYDLVQIYKDLLKLGFIEVNVPPDLLHLRSTSDFEKLCKQLDHLKDYILEYCASNDNFPFGLFITWIRRIFLPKMNPNYNCGLGSALLSIDINGDIYPCHRFCSDDEAKLGNVFNPTFIQKFDDRELNSNCNDCWNKYTCSHGCRYNDKETGSIEKKHPFWCVYSKKMTELSLVLCSQLPPEHIAKILQISHID